jgi:cell division protein FtsL
MSQASKPLISTGISVLMVLCIALSAMGVINYQHQSRKLYAANERAVAQSHQLDAELESLVVQQRKLATPQRIEQVARTRLGMQPVTAGRTINVVYSPAAEVANLSEQGKAK